MREELIIAILLDRGIKVDSLTSIVNIWDDTDEEFSIAYDGRLDIKKTITSSNEAVRRLLDNSIDDILVGGVSDDDLSHLPPNLRSAQMNNQEAHEHWSKDELSEAIYHLTFALQGIICHLEEKVIE